MSEQATQSLEVQTVELPEETLAVQRMKNEAAIRLLREWLADESGYDEETWPIAKQTIEENRASYRRRFHD